MTYANSACCVPWEGEGRDLSENIAASDPFENLQSSVVPTAALVVHHWHKLSLYDGQEVALHRGSAHTHVDGEGLRVRRAHGRKALPRGGSETAHRHAFVTTQSCFSGLLNYTCKNMCTRNRAGCKTSEPMLEPAVSKA
jgi:hypothetical protein